MKYFLKKYKKNFILLIVIAIISNFLELISIFMLLPIFKSLSSSINLSSLVDLADLNFLNISSFNIQITLKMLLTICFCIYLFKYIFLLFSNYFISRSLFSISTSNAQDLINIYFKKRYSEYSKVDRSQIIQNTINESANFAFHLLGSLLTIFSEALFIIILLLIFIIIKPTETIFLVSIVTILFLLYYFLIIKTFIKNYGVIRFKNDMARIKVLNNIIENYQQIKIYNQSTKFLEKFQSFNKVFNLMQARLAFFSQVPRHSVEFIGATLVLSYFFYIFYNGIMISDQLPVIGISIVIAFKLLPSFNKIISALGSIEFSKAAYNFLANEFKEFYKKTEILENQNLVKNRFNNFEKITLNSIDFSFEKKEIYKDLNINFEKNKIYGILGPSGSGKSTLVNLISGFLIPNSGVVKVDNINIRDHENEWQNNIGLISQSAPLLNSTIEENITFGNYKENKNQLLSEAVKISKLEDFVAKSENKINTEIGDSSSFISGGQAQRIAIARVVYSERNVILLDEATSALDKETEIEILDSIKNMKTNKIIILISHNLQVLEVCDEILELKNKKLIKINK
jgi:ATP-binding cassette, subfamily B, bacterial PglK